MYDPESAALRRMVIVALGAIMAAVLLLLRWAGCIYWGTTDQVGP